uniref:Uncharacterized protein n=1 Tax=Arundo donax TaxID=35708 RepID=A0A0A9GN74_ARUDO
MLKSLQSVVFKEVQTSMPSWISMQLTIFKHEHFNDLPTFSFLPVRLCGSCNDDNNDFLEAF